MKTYYIPFEYIRRSKEWERNVTEEWGSTYMICTTVSDFEPYSSICRRLDCKECLLFGDTRQEYTAYGGDVKLYYIEDRKQTYDKILR